MRDQTATRHELSASLVLIAGTAILLTAAVIALALDATHAVIALTVLSAGFLYGATRAIQRGRR